MQLLRSYRLLVIWQALRKKNYLPLMMAVQTLFSLGIVLGYPLLFAVSGLLIGVYVVIGLRWLPETRPSGTHVGTPPIADLPAGVGVVGVPMEIPATFRDGSPGTGGIVDGPRLRIFAAFLPLLLLVPLRAEEVVNG